MGCNCGGTQPTSYVEGDNYAIYGYLPTELPPASTIVTSGLIIGWLALIAYMAVTSAEKKKERAKRGRLYY